MVLGGRVNSSRHQGRKQNRALNVVPTHGGIHMNTLVKDVCLF